MNIYKIYLIFSLYLIDPYKSPRQFLTAMKHTLLKEHAYYRTAFLPTEFVKNQYNRIIRK